MESFGPPGCNPMWGPWQFLQMPMMRRSCSPEFVTRRGSNLLNWLWQWTGPLTEKDLKLVVINRPNLKWNCINSIIKKVCWPLAPKVPVKLPLHVQQGPYLYHGWYLHKVSLGHLGECTGDPYFSGQTVGAWWESIYPCCVEEKSPGKDCHTITCLGFRWTRWSY